MRSSIEFFLGYPANRCCFAFGKHASYFLFCSIILLYSHSALAFFSDDRIDDDFSYRSLHVEMSKTKRGGCYLEGEILNNTNIVQEGVTVTFYAYDFFDHSLWKQTVHIDIVDPFYNSRKGHAFRKKLSRCDVPAKFQFKVSGVKGKAAKKVIQDKAKRESESKDSGSRNIRHKKDLSADMMSGPETPVVPVRKYLIILTNGKEIPTDSYFENDHIVNFYQDGNEVQISKDKVSAIRKLD
jgi:hypothetical protein